MEMKERERTRQGQSEDERERERVVVSSFLRILFVSLDSIYVVMYL